MPTKHSRWAKSRIGYHSNSIATFPILLRAGDISLNPGPENNQSKTTSCPGPTRKHIAPRCFKCENPVARNHKRLERETCHSVTHIQCANTNSVCIKNMRANQLGSWTCSHCSFSVLPFESVKDLNSIDESCESLVDAHLWREFPWKNKNSKLLIGTIYRSELILDTKVWLDKFDDLLCTVMTSWDGLLPVTGDINICLLDSKPNMSNIERQYRDLLESLNLTQHITRPTTVTRTTKSLTD